MVTITPDEGPSFLSTPYWLDRFIPHFTRIAIGTELATQDEEALMSSFHAYAAERKAIELLSFREQPRFALRTKLQKRGFPKPIIEIVLDTMTEKKYLSDERFSSAWIRSRLRRNPEGEIALFRSLAMKGIDRETAKAAVKIADENGSLAVGFALFSEKLLRKPGMTREKACASCIRKGFSSRQARELSSRFPKIGESISEEMESENQ